MLKDVYLAGGVRTPIGAFGGSLAAVPAPRLGALAIGESLSRAGVPPGAVDEVVMGNVVSAGLGQNVARQCSLGAGLPVSVGATSVNRVCGSGLKAVMMASQAIQLGGHVSIGIGDNPYLELGAPSNAELVRRVVELARTLGREIATPQEARAILGV